MYVRIAALVWHIKMRAFSDARKFPNELFSLKFTFKTTWHIWKDLREHSLPASNSCHMAPNLPREEIQETQPLLAQAFTPLSVGDK